MHRSRPRSLPARRLGPVRRTARTSPGFTLLELLPILLLIVVIILLIYIVSLLDTPASTATISGTTAGPIAALEIVPDVAEVEAESWFRLRARPRDAAGNVIRECDCVMIEWTLDPAAGPLTDHGTDSPHGVIVQAAAVTTETTVKVSAKLGTVEGEAWITVVPKTATLGDRVEVDHDGGLVEVALVSGKNSAEPSIWRDEPLPFVGFRDLGQMSTGTADRVAVFSSERELGFTGNQPAFAWPGTANSEVVEASRSTPVAT